MPEKPPRDREENAAHLHGEARSLDSGERVRINDREVPLAVTDRHTQPNPSRSRKGPYHVIELEGNGTEYHLLCWEGALHGPMLYRRSQWVEVEESATTEYDYTGSGERVTDLQTVEAATVGGEGSETDV